MNLPISVTQSDLLEILLNVATIRPVFIWGAPGIGKSALVEKFANQVGLPCVSLLGSQLAPEDIIGIPQIQDDVSTFLPPKMIARQEPYVLFLDELNACSQEVQKAFYSLIHERRIGEYHLFSEPPKTEEPYSTPRSWHMLSDALKEYHVETANIPEAMLKMITYGCISASHAGMFLAFTKQLGNTHLLADIIKGEAKWPAKPEDRDVLYFLSQSFRAKLLHELPENKQNLGKDGQYLVHRAKALIKELSSISYEIAQMVVSADEGKVLPEWFMIEIVRDLPRLIQNNM
ncbi:MAG: AAA family ATPase [Lachnospiraceae bacterium]|nr:AAA family ATPase [Lachnospiraceae bacterium]